MATYKPKKKIDNNGALEDVKIPIDSVDGLNSKLNTTKQLIQDLDKKVTNEYATKAEIADKIGIEEVDRLDMYMGMVESPQTDDGIYWSENAEFQDKYGSTLKTVETFHHIPISSGEGIKFEQDEEAAQVKISTDLPTVKAKLTPASEVGGGPIKTEDLPHLGYIDISTGSVDSISISTSGIFSYHKDVERELIDEDGSYNYEHSDFGLFVPIVAGEGVEFENDSDKNVVKINSFKNEYNAHKHTITPSGNVSSTFSGDSLTSTGTYKPSGEVSSTFTGTTMTSTGTFTPEGTISTVSHKPSGSVTVTATTSTTGNYTPVGSVSKPTISVSPSFSTVLASCAIKGTFADGGLTLSLSTTTDDVVKSATASLDSTPTFTGTKVNISASFSGDSFSVTPTFTGTSGSVSVSGTTAGSVGSTFSGTSANISVSGTPSGTITSEFEGTSLQTTSTPV